MRKYQIPSIASLLAFEAAARHQSFTLAARELFLTESAISRQINTLESNLGVRLFVRSRQRVMLTRTGKLYGIQVRRTLDALDRDTTSIMMHGTSGSHLELAVLPTFASHWLIPRIGRFNERHPDTRVNMIARTEMFSFADSHLDAAIHYGQPDWPGTSHEFLFGEELVPICSPALLRRKIRHASELLDYPLLHSSTRTQAWSRWFDLQGVSDPRTMLGVRYELHTMLISGAAAGLGIALIPRFFIDGNLAQWGLVTPFERATTAEGAYYLVYPTELTHGPALTDFRTWLREEADGYQGISAPVRTGKKAARGT
jgi:LysR family transcriptional regulator, glycine cleavage system transcriptional activator